MNQKNWNWTRTTSAATAAHQKGDAGSSSPHRDEVTHHQLRAYSTSVLIDHRLPHRRRRWRVLRHDLSRRRRTPQSDEEDHDPLVIVALSIRFPTRTRKERRPAAATTSTAQGARRQHQSGAPSKAACGCTLDEELCISDGVMEGDLPAFDIEPHTYTTVGSVSGRTCRLPCAR